MPGGEPVVTVPRVGEDARVLRASLRVLDRPDLDAALAICHQDTVANVFVEARLRAHGVSRAGGGELWGYYDGGTLRSLCWAGANLVPVQAGPDAVEAFAARARRQGRQCSSIVGPAGPVLDLWSRLAGHWGVAREVRGDQPLMSLAGPPLIPPDPHVRRSTPGELELVIPACISMFTEEVGYSPVLADGGSLYRSQVSALVLAGRSLVRIGRDREGDVVLFKAELGSVTPHAVQVQGVWVNPVYRGQGLAAPAMAAVVEHCYREVAPVTTLYVNGFNTRAVYVYQQVGFARVGTFATVLF
jgi:predicted GNAT family acetyltransferase